MDAVYEENYRGYTIKLYPEEYIDSSPREWDNLGTMLCFNRRYDLGDPTDWKLGMFDSWAEVEACIWDELDAAIVLPLAILDHSGLWMRVGYRFREDSGGWDTSRVGFVYVTKQKLREEYSRKRISKKLLKLAEKILCAEVETYSYYLSGEVYGWRVEETSESCWGYFGWQDSRDYMLSEARASVDWEIKHKLELHAEQVKAWIKKKVPLIYRSPAPLVYGA